MTAPHHRLSCLAVMPHPRLPHRFQCHLAHEGLAPEKAGPPDPSRPYGSRGAGGDAARLHAAAVGEPPSPRRPPQSPKLENAPARVPTRIRRCPTAARHGTSVSRRAGGLDGRRGPSRRGAPLFVPQGLGLPPRLEGEGGRKPRANVAEPQPWDYLGARARAGVQFFSPAGGADSCLR